MPFGIGPLELGIVLLIALLFVGPKRLPGMGKSLGGGIREFKDSVSLGDGKDDDDDTPALPKAQPRDEAATASDKRATAADSTADAGKAFGNDD